MYPSYSAIDCSIRVAHYFSLTDRQTFWSGDTPAPGLSSKAATDSHLYLLAIGRDILHTATISSKTRLVYLKTDLRTIHVRDCILVNEVRLKKTELSAALVKKRPSHLRYSFLYVVFRTRIITNYRPRSGCWMERHYISQTMKDGSGTESTFQDFEVKDDLMPWHF